MQADFHIETVYGRMDEDRSSDLLDFWAAQGALAGEEAEQRLREVVCVVRDGDGAIAGACSAFAAELPLVSGRRFWVLRSLLPGAAAGQLRALVAAAFAALEAQFDRAPGAPVGLAVALRDEDRRRWPDAEWNDPPMRMIYAGYFGDGRQARIAYFHDACIAPGEPHNHDYPPLPDAYRIVPFAEQDAVSGDDVIELWLRERVLPPDEARRRVAEIQLVAIDADDRPVGVTTSYLQYNEQLGIDAWYYRAFVAQAHRMSEIAVWIAVRGREHLEQRYADGVDRRAPAMIYEVENEGLKAYFPQAHWLPTDFLFIGENERGAHVRVHWFPGAVAPEPPQGSA